MSCLVDTALLKKYEKLKKYISSLGSVAVAFSSGVDSTFLLYAAKDALDKKAIAITANLNSFPWREFDEAKNYCEKTGVKHIVVKIDELLIDGFSDNPPNRCYLCKKSIFSAISNAAHQEGITAILEGSNLDDNGDYRPGLKAIEEMGVISPLRHIGFTKQEIRDLSEYLNIPTWNKPSYACLSSRFPYGEVITKEKLKMVERAEQFLMDKGFSNMRVRIHGNVARLELLPDDFTRIMEEKIRNEVYITLQEFGFDYVALDLKGYRTGSMNETILK